MQDDDVKDDEVEDEVEDDDVEEAENEDDTAEDELLISSHLLSHVIYIRKFFSTVFISSDHWSTFLISTKFFSTHLSCSARQKKALTVREKSLAQKNNWAPRVFAHRHLRRRCIYTEKPFLKYVALQSLHKALPSTTLYYKAAKPAPSTSQYHFAQQSLHALPSTTLYYKACTKHFPVLLCTTKLAQRKLLHTATSSAEKLLHTANFLNREVFTRFYKQQALHKEAFTHSKRLYTEHFYTESVYTWQAFIHTQKLLHTSRFTHRKLLHTASFYRKRMTPRSFLVHNDNNKNYSSKTGWISAPQQKNVYWSTFLIILHGSHQRQNWENLLTNHYRSLDAIPIRFTMSSRKRE